MAGVAALQAMNNTQSTSNGSRQSDAFPSTPTAKTQRSDSVNFSATSPTQAKRALEDHIADTDRRIRDASQLGTTLLGQKQLLLTQLVEVEDQEDEAELTPELKQKLADLEKEFNEVARDTARLNRGKRASRDFTHEVNSIARDSEELSATGRTSPTKLNIASASTSRKARHGHTASASQVKDLTLATEISQSLLNEVRTLQSQLVEKEESLKRAQKETTDLHAQNEVFTQRLRGVDDNEQRYKDENWNLETQVQDLSNHIKEISTREEKLLHSLNVSKAEKSTAEREYEELRLNHGKLSDDHSSLKRQHDLDLSGLRRDIADGNAEREKMQRRVDELQGQNKELAQAIAYRVKNETAGREVEEPAEAGLEGDGLSTPEGSPPPSPSKLATPRHGGLESETLKSSLAHAHRMIQNLKNNIHREKTEKVELKRLLQQTQDDLEARGGVGINPANAGRKRQPPRQDASKKPARPSKLGGYSGVSEEIINDPSWEEYSETPIRKSIEKDDSHDFSTDASDAFETADERNTTDDTDAFETGAESIAGDSEDDLTETEADSRTPSGGMRQSMHRHRNSVQSTASDEDQFDASTPPAALPRYKLKMSRGLSRSVTPGNRASPAPSSMSNQSGPTSGLNLADELEDMDDASMVSSTPARSISSRFGKTPEPELSRRDTVVRSPSAPVRPAMVDSSMMTEPWKPELAESPHVEDVKIEHDVSETGVAAAAGAAVGAAISSVFGSPKATPELQSPIQAAKEATPVPVQAEPTPEPLLAFSTIASQFTTPVTPKPQPPVSPKKTEATRTPLAARDPNIPLKASSAKPIADGKPDKDTVFVPPPVPSIRKDHNLPPTSQAFLNDVLGRIHNRSKSQPQARSNPATPERSSKVSFLPAESNSTPRRKTVTDGRPEGRPSFAISIEGRHLNAGDATPPDVGKRSNSMTSSSAASKRFSRPLDFVMGEPSLKVQSPAMRNDGSFHEPTLLFGSPMDDTFRSRQSLMAASQQPFVKTGEAVVASQKPATSMIESGTQTSVSGDQIENLVQQSRKAGPSIAFNSGTTPAGSPRSVQSNGGRAMSLGSTTDPSILRTLNKSRPMGGPGARRPGSPTQVPPLPADHREVIAAAAASRTSSLLSVQPPPASSLRVQTQQQAPSSPRTPNATAQMPVKGNTPRNRTSSVARSEMSRRSSVSSFASELDARFNIAPQNRSSQNIAYDGFEGGNTDPRMIQAITQTMIGEFLWKYVRKTGRGELSDNRHRRFFWIHPYTKTLYWSASDPSLAGRSEAKAKSVQIEAVRVVTDENPSPPGLCQKSIVIVTPGRSIKFTAPTTHRHETWFNALSYLLLRAVPDDGNNDVINSAKNYSNVSGLGERSNTMSSITAEDVAEFNPASGYRSSVRSTNRGLNPQRMSAYGSTGSTASVNHQYRQSSQGLNSTSFAARQNQAAATKRQSQMSNGSDMSPLRSHPIAPIEESLASRQNSIRRERPMTASSVATEAQTATEVDADGFRKPALPANRSKKPADATAAKSSPRNEGRMSSITSKLRRLSRAKSASDVAPPNEEQPPLPAAETGARLENVRACCDGKHDVGDLHGHRHGHSHGHGSRHNSMTSRTWSFGSHH